MIIVVRDGQGGGIGSTLNQGLGKNPMDNLEIHALGTNSIATSRMMKAGANRGATGENAIVNTSPKVDIIIGPPAILMPNAMMGQGTPEMAKAVASSDARKILIPLNQEKVLIMGATGGPLPHLVEHKIILEPM